MSAPLAAGRPGFVDGALSLPRAAAFLARSPALWPLAAVPVLVLLVVATVLLVAVLDRVPGAVGALLPEARGALGELAVWAARGVASLLAAFLALLLAVWVTPALSGPAMERLVIARERDLGEPERAPLGLLRELGSSLRAQLAALFVVGPIVAATWVLALATPPLALVVVPVKLAALSLLVAWTLLDFPLSLRGFSIGERIALLARSLPAVLGFSAVFGLVAALPLSAVLALPLGALAAADLSTRMRRAAGGRFLRS